MAKVDANEFPKVILVEGAAPATPSSGQVKLYAKVDGLLYSKDDAGAETALGGGGGGGLTQAYVGYNTAGGSLDTPGVNNKIYLKSVTLAAACLVTAIEAYVDSASGTSNGPHAAIYTDNAGAPDKVIAHNLAGLLQITGGARWVSVPIGKWLVAGTYWLAIRTSDSSPSGGVVQKLAYDGSGSDRTAQTTGPAVFNDYSGLTGATTTSNKFSIRGNTIA